MDQHKHLPHLDQCVLQIREDERGGGCAGKNEAVITCNALLDGYCLLGETDSAKQILFDNLEEDRGMKPNIVSYNSLISGYCKNGRVDEAWLIFLEVPSKGLEHNAITYNAMIHGLFSDQRFAEGKKLYKDMEARGVQPNNVTFNTLLDGLCRNMEIDEAFSLLHMIEGKGVNPNLVTYGTLIYGLCKNGEHDVARDLFTQLPSEGLQPEVRIYNMIIGSLRQQGCMEKVECLLVEVVLENRGCAPDRVTYSVIVGSMLKKNELHQAIPLLGLIHQREFLADRATLSMLIDQVQGQSGDDFLVKSMKNVLLREMEGCMEEAERMLVEMENRGCAPNRVTFNVIVGSLLKKKELHKAIPLLELIHQRGSCSDPDTLSMLIDQVQGQSGDDFLVKLMKNILLREMGQSK